MSKLKLYSIFHLNGTYSSISEEDFLHVMEKVYWPLLDLIQSSPAKIAIEASGYTLEKIQSVDKSWIQTLRGLIEKNRCEFLGTGYAQIIGPLVPSEVNRYNLRFGNEVYNELLGFTPAILYISEQAYSAGMVPHYLEAGYRAMVMEWNNPASFHPEWDESWQYFPQVAVGTKSKKIPVIWNHSIAFQKFQRTVHGEFEIEDYFDFLAKHLGKENRFFPIYGSDAEVFDFRPGRYKTEALSGKKSEWARMKLLFKKLDSDSRFEFVFPSQVLSFGKNENAGHLLHLESPEQPILVKKQEKYNVSRWALSGRDDLINNTKCYSVYQRLLREENRENLAEWKELCFLWSSDFRTHIEGKRYKTFVNRLNKLFK